MKPEIWNRDELYAEVWEQPLLKLQAKYGVSAVAIGKVCRKLRVPLPGRGYWARKASGKKVKRISMPEFQEAPVIRRMRTVVTPKPSVDSSDPELAQIAAVESRPLPLKPEQHKFVASCAGLLRRARTNDYGIIEPPKDKPCLDVRVSKELLDRALALLSTLLFALEENGFEVKIGQGSASVQIFGQNVCFGIVEDLRVKERREEKRFFGTQKVIVYERSGNLVFQISEWAENCRKRWADAKTQRLENLLPHCLGGLMLVARTVRIHREQIRARQLEWERQERVREELAREIQKEEKRLHELETWMTNWQKAKLIREFVATFEKASAATGVLTSPDSPKGKWAAWALQQADRFDPLVESPPSVLDRKPAQPQW